MNNVHAFDLCFADSYSGRRAQICFLYGAILKSGIIFKYNTQKSCHNMLREILCNKKYNF